MDHGWESFDNLFFSANQSVPRGHLFLHIVHNAQSVYNFVLQLHLNSWMSNLETQGFCFIASYFVLEQPVIL